MAESINLWPWRQQRLQQQRKRWLVTAGVLIVVAVLLIVVGRWGLTRYWQASNQFAAQQSQQMRYQSRLQTLRAVLGQVDRMQNREQQLHSWLTWLPTHLPMQMQLHQWQFSDHNMTLTVATPASADMQILADQVAARQDVSQYAIDAVTSDTQQHSGLLQALRIAIDVPTQ